MPSSFDPLWHAPGTGLLAQMRAAMAQRQAHPARTVVLLPYAQLMPLAQRFWAQAAPDGFAPRFESTLNWSHGLGGVAVGAHDLRFDTAMDMLQAPVLLESAGLGAQREALSARLVEAAHQLAPLAAAVPPAQRADWAVQARNAVALGMEAPVLALECVVARIALEWAAASAYATDVLWSPSVPAALDCIIVLDGFQTEPLVEALCRSWGDKVARLTRPEPPAPAMPALHAASDSEDEALRAAACVLRHIEAGRTPVALVATDRLLTRRIRAMLAAQNVRIRDETGWKLSTTRAAAQMVVTLRAARWDASSDAVLDWLKNAPAFRPRTVQALEKALRKAAVQSWSAWSPEATPRQPAVSDAVRLANQLRATLQASRPLVQWLAAVRALLQASGQWPVLVADAAGAKLLAALRLEEGAEAEFAHLPQAARRLRLAEFSGWVGDALEAASYVPDHPQDEQVVVLPLSQLLARPFPALVLPGCDEVRLAVSPEPPGAWTASQREALGLPSRAVLEAASRAAWANALQTPHTDVLWRQSDASGETLLASPLVQALWAESALAPADDPRVPRSLAPQPSLRPLPVGAALPVQRLSASAYEDLRRCPYRFFGLRQLGLQESQELTGEVDKRDFGTWLHAVLKTFHEALNMAPAQNISARVAMINVAAEQVTRDMHLEPGEFLPFASAWPRVRDGYLAWLAPHEAAGGRFEQAESALQLPLGPLTLIGTIDRVDQVHADGSTTALVIDYKTENALATQKRIKQPLEDTQLAFYAALLPQDTLRAAYLNVGEKDGSQLFEQTEVVEARDALVHGILDDMQRIADGAVLAALGEGAACTFCAARGLCRKDWWSD
ncbi:ATP-dependent helicase/nuclease subunit B [Rhodoferax ferrireducens]|uniref:ATP-dependent helicase/nuclease subunit B n=1 Tax=Rhodoferax ferrireducens TaxID=192843 RepID=A0ABU2C9Z7_9BURK|nr:PD-(D/E)XK nuclease family protein [Rhodoferax ferrireducens]MDR7378121.1 ATP-dependent helicase/nuclease subunit B [Rhodoferax ferrireducens]